MIIDADTHIAPKPEGSLSITADKLVARMDRAGVDKCLTWVHPPYIKTRLDEYVEYVYQATQTYPDRICGLGWIDPNLGMDQALALTHRCMTQYGFYGIKLNGSQNGYFIDDKSLTYPLIEIVAKLNGIVAFHSACDDYVHTPPHLVGKIAKDFPDTNILMIHMGGESYKDLSRSAIEVARECANITLVGSEVVKPSLLNAITELGASRVAFGSDTPFGMMGVEVAGYRALMDEINLSAEDQALIMGGNIERLLTR
jgi:predicted TIM-barrel fold metal-dependent hydrolase